MPLSPYGVSLRLLLFLAQIIPLVGQQRDFEAAGIRVITAADPGFFDAAKALNTSQTYLKFPDQPHSAMRRTGYPRMVRMRPVSRSR